MSTVHLSGAVAAMTVSTSTLVFAHGDGAPGPNLYHYLSSPDHVITFCLLSLAALAVAAWSIRGSVMAARQRKR